MSEPALIARNTDPAAALEAEIDEAIALCGGDVRNALRATLIANTYLQGEVDRLEATVSAGFGRRRSGQRPKTAVNAVKITG